MKSLGDPIPSLKSEGLSTTNSTFSAVGRPKTAGAEHNLLGCRRVTGLAVAVTYFLLAAPPPKGANPSS